VTLRLLSYNIRFGGHGREQALAETIVAAAPDLVVFQEATDPAVIARLSEATKFPFWAARRNHSIGFLSREQVEYHEWHYPANARHSFLEIVPAGSNARIFGLHLSARFSRWDERRRAREIRSLLDGIKRHQNGFHALVGDFNTLAPGEVLQARSLPLRLRPFVWASGGRIRWRTIQTVLDAGYVDAYRAKHPDQPGLTMPSGNPHVRLDYVFVPRGFADRVLSCEVVQHGEGPAASDHLPVVADLRVD
jgi:exodeoxyribonuclease III